MKCDTRENLPTMDTLAQASPPDLTTIGAEDVADMLGISVKTLARLTDTGQIGAINVGAGTTRKFRYLRRHVDAFLASREQVPA